MNNIKSIHVPEKKLNLMTNNKINLFKNQKKSEIILTESDNENIKKEKNSNDVFYIKERKYVLEDPLFIKGLSESLKTIVLEDLIEYYKNELFELTNGCWILKTNKWKNPYDNRWNRKLIIDKIDNIDISHKIYKTYMELPIDFTNISHYELYLDNREINSFHGKVLLNVWNIPREYTILIYFNNYKYPICYQYKFSLFQFPNLECYKYKTDKIFSTNELIQRKINIETKLHILNNIIK